MKYDKGTISIQAGTNIVTGQGTEFTANVPAGAFLSIPGWGRVYQVGQVVSDDLLLLSEPVARLDDSIAQPITSLIDLENEVFKIERVRVSEQDWLDTTGFISVANLHRQVVETSVSTILTDNFENSTGWIARHAAKIAIVNGKMRVSNGAAEYGYAEKAITCQVGRIYRLVVEDAGSGDGATTGTDVSIGSNAGAETDLVVTNANFDQIPIYFRATSTTMYLKFLVGGNIFNAWKDFQNVKVTEIATTDMTLIIEAVSQFGTEQTLWSYGYDAEFLVRLFKTAGGNIFLNIVAEDVQTDINLGSFSGTTPITIALGLQANNVGISINGGDTVVDTSVYLPQAIREHIGADFDAAHPWLGGISKITHYPRRLSNSELKLASAKQPIFGTYSGAYAICTDFTPNFNMPVPHSDDTDKASLVRKALEILSDTMAKQPV